jgi:predicted TIM-barrel fold metal-dependent hydrolase
MIDFNSLIGPFPFRHVPHPEPEILDRVVQRDGLEGAWVGHLPSAFHRDPSIGNEELFRSLEKLPRLKPVPTIRPDWPEWRESLDAVVRRGAVAIRAYPQHWGMGPGDSAMRELAVAAGQARVPLMLTVRFEDLRQRHPLDVAGDLPAAVIRQLARSSNSVRLIVTAAGREMIEEVHWGLTPEEQGRVFWDISWIWGPPEDHLAKLFRTIGASRFVYGTQWPMRLTQTPRANLDLLPDDLSGVRLAGVEDVLVGA